MFEEDEGYWKTFEGRETRIDFLSHQHLSNIVHFYTYVTPAGFGYGPKMAALDEIEKRFNGQLLPYRPSPRFEYEVGILKEKGYLVQVSRTLYDIIVEGKWIGELDYNRL